MTWKIKVYTDEHNHDEWTAKEYETSEYGTLFMGEVSIGDGHYSFVTIPAHAYIRMEATEVKDD